MFMYATPKGIPETRRLPWMLRRAALSILAGLTLCSCPGRAADREKPERPEALVKLVDGAAALPAELASDALLSVIESGRITDREWQAQILQDAFRYAGLARYPAPAAAAVGAALNTDTDAGMLSAALRDGLDRLSLRCRTIDHLIGVDRKQAMDMFLSMGPSDPNLAACTDALYARPDPYFSTARNLMAACFTAKERQQGRDLRFAEGILRGVSTPAGIVAAVDLIQGTRSRAELVSLTAALLSALSQMRPDDRSLEGLAGSLSDHTFQLANLYLQDVASAEPVVRAWRAYLVRVLSATRCAENVLDQDGSPSNRLVRSFNTRLVPMAPAVAPISEDETKATKTGDRANVVAFWSSPADLRLEQEFKALRFGPSSGGSAPPAKAVPSLGDFLAEFENWRSQQGPDAVPFHEASILYRGLITDVEDDATWRGILRSFIEFLKQSPLERDDPPQWYLHFSRLLKLSPKFKTEARRSIIRQDVATLGDGLMSEVMEREDLLAPRKR